MTVKADSEFITKGLLVLETQLIYARHHCSRLEWILGQRELIPLAQTTLALHSVLDLITQTVAGLMSRVIALDSRTFGATVGSLGELLLRAQTAVIALQLPRLRQALRDAGSNADSLLQAGPYCTLDEVIESVEVRVRRSNAA